MLKRLTSIFTAVLLASSLMVTQASAASSSYDYSGNTDKSNFVKYVGNYNAVQYPQEQLNAAFTTDTIAVDGAEDAAYGATQESRIDHLKAMNGYTYAQGSETYGYLKSVWNGPELYILVEVHDSTPVRNASAQGGASSANPAVPTDCDSVEFAVDLYDDKVTNETDTIGDFTISSSGVLSYYANASIPSLSSVMADPNHPEYTNIIDSYAAKDLYASDGTTVIGYTVELALHIESTEMTNGTKLGLDIGISDAATVGGNTARIGTAFWSHDQDSLYTDFNHSNTNSVDWGDVTLTGWNGTDEFAFSTWRLSNAIRYLDSAFFQKGVWTSNTQAELDAARQDAEILLAAAAQGVKDKAKTDAAADRLEAAIKALRWADTKYPDPVDLKVQNTLPNPYQFFNSTRLVNSSSDWAERRAEILDMAQFYEYGYKPGAPDSMEITQIKHYNIGDNIKIVWGPWSWDVPAAVAQDEVTVAITVGQTTVNLTYTVYLPTADQLAAAGHTGKVPVVLSFDGDVPAYREAGYAVVSVPAGSSGDVRTTEYAWGTRSGAFYTLYPYTRNGSGALNEVSSEMAAAWSATRVIDSLEKIGNSEVSGASAIAAAIDPSKLAVTGFSINGKYAFVAAVFDERISVCIPGSSGASGTSPWRYVYTGHEYDWTGTSWAPSENSGVSALQTASGTETMANSIRHNRVREISLFTRFLTFGNYYQHLEGAYGFGTRLPYDQDDLIATLAPRALVLVNTVNDYNDGCEADCLGLEVAKSVYSNLGYNADDLLKFNLRPAYGPGDPHGTDDAQLTRTGEYLNHYFYGTAMTAETDTWLNTDPFNLKVSNNQTETPFDYYYGGFNTITGGANGIDGWYSYKFKEPEIIEGSDASWTKGSTSDLKVTSNANFNDFLRVEIDGSEISNTDYTAVSGSTIVTLKAAYLETLAAAQHTLGVVSVNGTAETEFEIVAADSTGNNPASETSETESEIVTSSTTGNNPASETGKSPKTGDSGDAVMLLFAAVIAGAGILGLTLCRKHSAE